MKKIILAMTGVLFIAGCGGSGGGAGGNSGGLSAGQVAALQCLSGTWVRCSDDGSTSTKVTMVVNGSTLNETIESFNGNDTCSGASNSSLVFSAAVEPGNIGESTALVGGTEMKLTPTQDIIGCGAGAPTFTIVQFESDCLSFRATIGAPSCDFASRPVVLDNLPFTKN